MVMNTFIQYIWNKFFQHFGYQFLKDFIPRHWLQFAEDAAAITGQESENQTVKRFQHTVYMESNNCKSWKMLLIRDEEMSNEVYTNKTEAMT